MSGMSRRELLRVLAAVPAAGFLDLPTLERASRHAHAAVQQTAPYAPAFFTLHELETVTVLADLVIPRDERSGSASDAGVPAFIDFMMIDRPALQLPIRGGLAWLDAECHERFRRTFVAAVEGERAAILDDIAWPARAPEPLSQGVAFFNRFRDLVASGFWSSKMGMEDLRFLGNRPVPVWNGCPEPVLRQLGVAYDD